MKKRGLVFFQVFAILILVTSCGSKLTSQPEYSSTEESNGQETVSLSEENSSQEEVGTAEESKSNSEIEQNSTSELMITEGTHLLNRADANPENWLRVMFYMDQSQEIIIRDDGSECFLVPDEHQSGLISNYQIEERKSAWVVGNCTFEYDYKTGKLYKADNSLQEVSKVFVEEVQNVKTHNDKPVWVSWVDNIATLKSVNDEGDVIDILTQDRYIYDYLWFMDQLYILDGYSITRAFGEDNWSLSFENQMISEMIANDENMFVILGNDTIYRVNITQDSFTSELIYYINWDRTSFIQNDILYSTAGDGATDLKLFDNQNDEILYLGETYQFNSGSYYNIQYSMSNNRIFVLDRSRNQSLVELSSSLEVVGTLIPKSIRQYVVVGDSIYYIPWGESTIYEFDLDTGTEKVFIQSANNVFEHNGELYYETMAPKMNLMHYQTNQKKSELIWEGHVSCFVYLEGLYYIVTPEGVLYQLDIHNEKTTVLEDSQIGYVGIHNEELIVVKYTGHHSMLYRIDKFTNRLVLIDILYGHLSDFLSFGEKMVSVRGDEGGPYIVRIDPSNHFQTLLNDAYRSYFYGGKYYLNMEYYSDEGLVYCYDPSSKTVEKALNIACNQMLGIGSHLYLANDLYRDYVADYNLETGEFSYIVEPQAPPYYWEDRIEIYIEDGELRYE